MTTETPPPAYPPTYQHPPIPGPVPGVGAPPRSVTSWISSIGIPGILGTLLWVQSGVDSRVDAGLKAVDARLEQSERRISAEISDLRDELTPRIEAAEQGLGRVSAKDVEQDRTLDDHSTRLSAMEAVQAARDDAYTRSLDQYQHDRARGEQLYERMERALDRLGTSDLPRE